MQTSVYGRCFEHFIIQQIFALNDYLEKDFSLSYLRTKDDAEVDLILTRPGQIPLFIEIKSTDRPENLSLKSFEDLVSSARWRCRGNCVVQF